MNNNQDNFNINPQMSNMNQNVNPNSNTFVNNQNGFTPQPELNVIPGMTQQSVQPMQSVSMEQPINNPVETPIQNNINQEFMNPQNNNINNQQQNLIQNQNNSFITQDTLNEMPTPQPMQIKSETSNEIYDELKIESTNRFINNDIDANNNLNQLNIEEEYSNMHRDYSDDPKVQQNLEQEQKKKNTITITGEAKIFLLIIAALLVFTFVMPYIFDFIRDIQY